MFKSFFWSRKWLLWAWAGAALIAATVFLDVYLLVLVNEWYGTFYDLLQAAGQPDVTINTFWDLLVTFAYLASALIAAGVGAAFFTNHWTLRWRQAMTEYYIDKWKDIDHEEYEGSSQRIQEDCMRFARLTESLSEHGLKSIATLFAFMPILWSLSAGVVLPVIGSIPGSLVWVALAIGLGGILISILVGIKLPGLEYNNQKVEAAFRKDLVYSEDDKIKLKDHFNLGRFTELFLGVKINYSRLFLHYTYFNTWKIFYFQLNTILPFLIMGPGLFAGAITLGIVMRVSNAFEKVHQAVTFLLVRWNDVMELASVFKRLREFQRYVDPK